MAKKQAEVKGIFFGAGGTLRTGEAIAKGIHPRTLYALREAGAIVQISRGVYQWAEMEASEDPDIVIIAKRIPKAIICLVSALSIHGLTTQIPNVMQLALPRNAREPILKHPPIEVHRFSGKIFTSGVTTATISIIAVRIYSPEKTLADCFRFRNKIGLDVVMEALRTYRRRPGASVQKVLEFARVCRVEAGIRPYLEAI